MKKLIAILSISALFLTGCGASSASVTNQGAADFAKTITDSSVVVLDVRTPGEFMVGHIANAINIDVEGMQFNADVSKLDKTKTYAVYCHSGRRSGIATSEMSKLGFSKLFNLDGGIGAWSAAGQQLVTN
ncbi:MAG: rhodanese-like domain-containing protein [Candidatus Nanopelagicaceae bacterium]